MVERGTPTLPMRNDDWAAPGLSIKYTVVVPAFGASEKWYGATAPCFHPPNSELIFFSICAGLGSEPLACGVDEVVPAELGRAALEVMQRLAVLSVPSLRGANPIELLDAMARTRAAACCPLVYGYVNYATAGDGREALRFADAPALGSTLGGTGIAITQRCPLEPALAQHLAWLLDPATQTSFMGAHEGQPSARESWTDAGLDGRSGGFYSGTLRTTEAAWVRPRFDGFIEFQGRGSELLRAGLAQRTPARTLLERLDALWRASLPTGAVL